MLEDKIYKDYIQALKSRDKEKVQFLSFLRAELKNHAKSLKKEKLEDSLALDILKKQKKRLLESKEFIDKSDREDLIKKAENEIAVIDGYLPQPLPRQEVVKIIDEVISEIGAFSMKDMGKVMKLALERLASRADSKEVSGIVKGKLSVPS